MERQTPRVKALLERARQLTQGKDLWEHARPVTQAKALWERGRRPLTMFAIGVGLAAPASAFMSRTDMAARRSALATSTADMAGSALETAELTDAQMTLGLSRIYEVPVGVAVEIHKAASAEGITPRLAFGLVRTESEFKRTAVSPVGAIGYTQVMPGTAKDLKPGTTRADLFNGSTNLHLGFKYLKSLIDRYDGNVRLALTAYNRGPGIVDRQLKRGRDPENGYATKVLSDPVTEKLRQEQRALSPDEARVTARPSHHARRHVARHTRHTARRHRPVVHHRTRRSRRHRR